LISLERRLDNVVCRLGFATSRDQARQLVTHGHVLVNGKKLDICSAEVNAGDVITLKERTRKVQQIQDSLASVGAAAVFPRGCSWMPTTCAVRWCPCRNAKMSSSD